MTSRSEIDTEAYILSKFIPIKHYIDGVWCDDKTVLIRCNNYRDLNSLFYSIYHDLDKRKCNEVVMIKHQSVIKLPHINKEFKFFVDSVKVLGYPRHSPIWDARGVTSV